LLSEGLLRRKTTFIVGAGASKDFGFPLGQELVSNIRSRVDTERMNPNHSRPVFNAAMESKQNADQRRDFGEAATDLCGGLVAARSIDRLLQSRMDRPLVVDMGKCSIATEILQQEGNCQIGKRADGDWSERHYSLVHAQDTWIARLFSILHEGVTPKQSSDVFKDISFITFNYDRCIERYLGLAFQHILNLSPNEAYDVAAQVETVHVYGSLGDLPDKLGNGGILFGGDAIFTRRAADSIRTFTEGAEDGTLQKVRAIIDDAEDIVFLGFGFDPVNLSTLFDQKVPISPVVRRNKRLFGTGLGAGPMEIETLHKYLDRPELLQFSQRFPQIECNKYINSQSFRAMFLN
jgi:hypothetical protein